MCVAFAIAQLQYSATDLVYLVSPPALKRLFNFVRFYTVVAGAMATISGLVGMYVAWQKDYETYHKVGPTTKVVQPLLPLVLRVTTIFSQFFTIVLCTICRKSLIILLQPLHDIETILNFSL